MNPDYTRRASGFRKASRLIGYGGFVLAALVAGVWFLVEMVINKKTYASFDKVLVGKFATLPVIPFYAALAALILIGIAIIKVFPALFWIGIGMFALVFLFSVITLPVEFNASHRALVWLQESNSLSQQELKQAKNALSWAASTYVVAALSSLASLLYYISIGNSRR